MGRDVVAALSEAISTHGKMAPAEAEEHVKSLQAQGRLVQERTLALALALALPLALGFEPKIESYP